jgi:DNA-binding LytR/AlgR family response regulator
MLNCVALDDEPMALEVIKTFCDKIPFLNLSHTFTQVSSAQKHLRKFPVDLIFLDIQMPDLNGIDFYKNIKQETMVIFTTAYSNYAVEGFNVNAIDYLLKPIEFERFKIACGKAKDYCGYLKKSNSDTSKNLYVRSEYALIKIPYSDILYMETMDDYIKIHLQSNKTILTLMSLKKMLEKIPQNEFVRVHQSFIVSLAKIVSVRGNNISLPIIDIPIGTSYKKDFLNIYSPKKQ